MIVKLLTGHHLEFLRLKGGCRVSSESIRVKMQHCWKSHALAKSLFCPNSSQCQRLVMLTCFLKIVANFVAQSKLSDTINVKRLH